MEFEWDAPLTAVVPLAMRDAVAMRRAPHKVVPGTRDLYIAARFPGFGGAGVALEDVPRVIDGARLLFEDGDTARALELLDLAIEQGGANQALRLARLEFAFLARDADLFVSLAGEFKRVCSASNAWPEVARLGRALAPAQALFGARQGQRAHEHYGPWPHMPNWIAASWDLTSEVLASDYHRLMKVPAPRVFDTIAARLSA